MSDVVRTPIPMLSAAAERIIGLMKSAAEGDVLTYEMLSAAAGFDVRRRRGVLGTAKNRVMVDDKIHFAAVRGVGYKRLTLEEAAETMSADLMRARRAARRGTKKAKRIDLLSLPEAKRAQFVARTSLCDIIQEATKPRAVARIEALATNTAIVAQREALEAIKKGL